MSTDVSTAHDLEMVSEILTRVTNDLFTVVDREIQVAELETERVTERAAGLEKIHISFKLAVTFAGETRQGCFLVPLPEAMALAAYLMMVPDEDVESVRDKEPDDTMKDALLEISSFIAGSCDAVLRSWYPEGCSVRPEGCQGVRPDVRPAFDYVEGDELVLGRATVGIADYEPFELMVMLPVLPKVA